MADIQIEASFRKGEDIETREETFYVGDGLKSDIETWVEETLVELADGAYLLSCEVTEWEDAYGDPTEFDDLDEYARFAEKVEEHGEAYRLRYEDIGGFDFYEQYQGCFEDEGDFAESISDNLGEIPDWVRPHVDWDSVARDIMMDYSSYDGNEGCHIFRD